MQRTDTYRATPARDTTTWIGNSLATILAGLAIASGVIGMLVGFETLGDSTEPFRDGLIWLLGAVILGLAANVFRREHHVVSAGGRSAPRSARPEEPRGAQTSASALQSARDSNDLHGMVVVSTEEGREVGTVRGMLFDAPELAVLALTVAPAEGGKGARAFVLRQHIRGVGRDAVTVQSEDNLQFFATKGRERDFVKSGVQLEGLRALTEQGNDIGKVSKVLLTDDCRIARIEIGGGVFSRKRRCRVDEIVAIGDDRIVVSRQRDR
jgi:uncharacterized protein YrrD